jgi:hypothetical protein
MQIGESTFCYFYKFFYTEVGCCFGVVVCLISSTIDLNAVGFEEGEGFEGFEEDSQ